MLCALFEFCACVSCLCAVVWQMSIANRMMYRCVGLCVLSMADWDVKVLAVRITVYMV